MHRASSALTVLNDNALDKSTHSLTHSLAIALLHPLLRHVFVSTSSQQRATADQLNSSIYTERPSGLSVASPS